MPITNTTQEDFLNNGQEFTKNYNGVRELLIWFIKHKTEVKKAFGGHYGSDALPNHMYCDQTVQFFRTLLMAKGFKSRVVVFEFDDGHGGKSHTFTEVWLEDERQWIYTDAFYNVIANSNAMQLINKSNLIEFLELSTEDTFSDYTRRKEVEDVFTNGHVQLYIENASLTRRVEFDSRN